MSKRLTLQKPKRQTTVPKTSSQEADMSVEHFPTLDRSAELVDRASAYAPQLGGEAVSLAMSADIEAYSDSDRLAGELQELNDMVSLGEIDASAGNLDKQIYSYYYNKLVHEDVRENDPLLDEDTIKMMTDYLKSVSRHASEHDEDSAQFITDESKSWVYGEAHNGTDRNLPMGRIYLNTVRGATMSTFLSITNHLQELGVAADTKMPQPNKMNKERSDSLVVYFNSKDAEKVFKVIDEAYNRNPRTFKQSVPRFTAQLKSKDGQLMQGIAFGQEPLATGVESFGSLRCKALRNVIRSNGRVEAGLFRDEAERLGIDPNSLAFNQGGTRDFQSILDRLDLDA